MSKHVWYFYVYTMAYWNDASEKIEEIESLPLAKAVGLSEDDALAVEEELGTYCSKIVGPEDILDPCVESAETLTAKRKLRFDAALRALGRGEPPSGLQPANQMEYLECVRWTQDLIASVHGRRDTIQQAGPQARKCETELLSDRSRAVEPLTDRAQAVAEVILDHEKPIFGKEICAKVPNLIQSTLTKHIVPELKEKRGLKNKPGAGYYFPKP